MAKQEMPDPAANAKAKQNVRVLFALVVLGVLANWLWEVAWAVVVAAARAPNTGSPTGDEMVERRIVVTRA